MCRCRAKKLLKFGSAVCISCIRMVTNLSLKTAIEKNIPMVMMGHSPGQLLQSNNEIIYKDNLIPLSLKKGLFKPLAKVVGNEVYRYLTLSDQMYRSNRFPYIINPFPLMDYDETQIYKIIGQLGWEKPDDLDPNTTNCQLNAFGIVKHKEKFNYHPYSYEMSMLVRTGVIDRREALRRIKDERGIAQKLSIQVENRLRG